MAPSSTKRRVRIGLLGSGTVGESVQDFVFDGDLEKRTGVKVEIVKIYTRRPKGKKWYRRNPGLFTTQPLEVTDHPEVDVLVEVLGSENERDLITFKGYLLRALEQGKSIVTSNKAVLARFGRELWAAAARQGRSIGFEACVGGGIPIIKSLRESLAAEEPEAVYGIVNGTCNYILSSMRASGRSYEASLREAQQRGYAEANPEADTSGMDSEYKLILLGAVTFGIALEPGGILRKGIEEIHPIDFRYAREKGSATIKYLAVARNDGGSVQAFVSPVLVPEDHCLASVHGITNAICFKGRRSQESGAGATQKQEGGGAADRDWNYAFIGPGAGGGPTAVAVLGDVCSIHRPHDPPLMGLPAARGLRVQSQDEIRGDFYIRFLVKDQSGIVGDICRIFGGKGIQIAEVWQLQHTQKELEDLASGYRLPKRTGNILPFVITLDRTDIGRLKGALDIIQKRDFIVVEPLWLPIWGS